MNKYLKILLATLVLLSFKSFATHNRAGEILYKRVAPFINASGLEVYTYSFTIIKYTDDGSGVADRCVDTVYFGDGTKGIAQRVNHDGSVNGCGCSPNKCGEIILNLPNFRVKKNVYTIIHTYGGIGSYKIRSFDPNRNQGVANIPNSVNTPFYIESYLEINAFSGSNSTPVFNFAPIDRACKDNCFFHNPGAFDADGDSLSYEITTSRGADGNTVSGYTFPDAGGGTYGIDAITGNLTWCSPQAQGEFNLAFIVREWRKNTDRKYYQIGYVLRDMQVLVGACPTNQPPQILTPQDTCVEAGTLIIKHLIISDPNPTNIITLQGQGGAFSAPSPIANIAPVSGLSSYTSTFTWQTNCNHIRAIPYISTFKADDQAQPINQVFFGNYSIKVVPPKITGLNAQALGTAVNLTWQASSCNPPLNPIVKYVIYRNNSCATFTYIPCKPGIDPTSGYIKIGETVGTNFTDNNNGTGLTVGENYSYVVVALYQDGSVSFASSSVCAQLKKDIPIITHVDIESTSINTGSILVKWIKPFTNAGNFDTLTFTGPYTIKVNYKTQSAPTFTTVFTATTPNFYQLATQFTHTALNTVNERKEYKLEFTAGTSTVGSSQLASSIFLNVAPGDRLMNLSWASNTPWTNYKYTIYRKNPGQTTYTAVATTSVTNYIDSIKIANRANYCYYILSEGQYSDITIPRPLLNKSQEVCGTAIDKTAPCTPTLTTNADCITGFVNLSWTNTKLFCPGGDDVIKYILYYKPTVDDEYNVLDTVTGINNTIYNIDYTSNNQEFISGCYAISAMDSSKNVSTLSQDYCIDICPLFELPNIVTINGDGINDFYKAIKVRQIKEINLMIFDRWGNLVYETKDPYFKWDCKSIKSGQTVSEGTFYYVCDVFENRVTGKKTRKLKGYLQVVK